MFLYHVCYISVILVSSSYFVVGVSSQRLNRIEDVYFRFYKGSTAANYVEIPLNQATRLYDNYGFHKTSPTVFYIHGYLETPQQESIQVIVNAYLQARQDTNVVLLDWTNMAHGLYFLNAVPNTKKVATAAAEQINILIESGLLLEKIHIIGLSLGSHVAGYIARDLKNKYGKTIKRITALDPAFPGFYPSLLRQHVNAADAEFVDVIHTDAGGYGAPVPTGTADFWPNGGTRIQPGCPLYAPIFLSKDNICSHIRSWRLYAESVLNPEAFPASSAASYIQFLYPIFRQNPTPETGMVYMGINCDNRARGSYYLTTNSQTPFSKGMGGLYP